MKVIILFAFEFPQLTLQPDTYWRNKIELHVYYIFFSTREKE